MLVAPWWYERLREGSPVSVTRSPWVRDFDFKTSKDNDDETWPFAVCRSSLYLDYLRYFVIRAEEIRTQSTRHWTRTLVPATETAFFSTIGPWLYLHSAHDQVRNYRVLREGKPGYAYFVRFAPLEAHRLAFELDIGLLINGTIRPDEKGVHGPQSSGLLPEYRQAMMLEKLEKWRKPFADQIASNRSKVPAVQKISE